MYGFGNTGSGESAWVKPRAHLTTYNIDLGVYYVPGCVAARAYARSLRTATSVVSNYKLDALVGSGTVTVYRHSHLEQWLHVRHGRSKKQGKERLRRVRERRARGSRQSTDGASMMDEAVLTERWPCVRGRLAR
jgi:hypothetical protein